MAEQHEFSLGFVERNAGLETQSDRYNNPANDWDPTDLLRFMRIPRVHRIRRTSAYELAA
jgi:hypothetical protein